MSDQRITNNIFRISAILYASNNPVDISQRQILRKIIDDVLFLREVPISVIELIRLIADNYNLFFSEGEVEDIIYNEKYVDSFWTEKRDDVGFVALTVRRRLSLQKNFNECKNLNDYIELFFSQNNIAIEKVEVIYTFLYHLFTANLEGYKHLLNEETLVYPSDLRLSNEDKDLINSFLNWENVEKNKAIYNLACYALEYCMLTNSKNAAFDLNSLRNKNLYLDTNILFRAIGLNGEDRQKRTLHFLSNFKRVKENLYITKDTDIEFRDTVRYYIDKIRRTKHATPRVKHCNFIENYDGGEEIFSAYNKWSLHRSNDSLELYEAYVIAEYEKVLEQFKISIDRGVIFEESDEETIIEYSSQIQSFSVDKRSHASEYDAKNILFIEKKRNGNDCDIYKTKCFFISSDNSLRLWDYTRNSNRTPIVMQPSQWFSIILRYLERTDDDYNSFVCFLNIRTNPSLLSEEQLYYAIEGINEMTSDVQMQKHLLRSFIEKELNDSYLGLDNEKVYNNAKEFAESSLGKAVKALQAESKINKQEIERLKDAQKSDAEKLEEIRNTSNAIIGEKDKEIEEKDILIQSYKDKETKRIVKQKRIWKSILWTFILLICLLYVFFAYCFVNQNFNYVQKLLHWLNREEIPLLQSISEYIVVLPIIGGYYSIRSICKIWSKKE